MPYRPGEREKYPKDWKKVIRPRILERSGGRCEFQLPETGLRCERLNGDPIPGKKGRVVLTIAHLNHQPEDCADTNLLAGCQRCHLNYDRPMKIAAMNARRLAKLAAMGAQQAKTKAMLDGGDTV